MHTHQYVSGESTTSAAVVANCTAGVLYRTTHQTPVARPLSRQSSSYHNRLSSRAFGPQRNSVPTSLTTSWPNACHQHVNGSGWINMALDASDHNAFFDDKMKLAYHNGRMSLGKENSVGRSPSIRRSGNVAFNVEPKQISLPNEQLYAAFLSLITVGFPASIVAILSLQLMLTMSYYLSSQVSESHISTSKLVDVFRDLALALCTVSLSTSVTAILSSFLQLLLCLKIAKTSPSEWRTRSLLYLRSGVYLRLFIDGAFFVGVPCFLLAVVLYVHMFTNSAVSQSTSSVVVTVIVGFSIVLCVAVLFHGVYSWLCGHLNFANKSKPDSMIFENNAEKRRLEVNNNLSTLV